MNSNLLNKQNIVHSSHQIKTINYSALATIISLLAISTVLGPVEAYAAKFDLNAFGSAALDPITQFVVKYWPAGLFISGTGGALLASGDLRTRAVGFGTGVAAGGLLIGGAANALGIV